MLFFILFVQCIFTVYGNGKAAMKRAKDKLFDPCPKTIKLPKIDKDENINRLKTKVFESKAGFEMTMQIMFDYDALPRTNQEDDCESPRWATFNFYETCDRPIFEIGGFSFKIDKKKGSDNYQLHFKFGYGSRSSTKSWDDVKKGDEVKIKFITRQDEAHIDINGMYMNLKNKFLQMRDTKYSKHMNKIYYASLTHKNISLQAFVHRKASKVLSINAKIRVYQKDKEVSKSGSNLLFERINKAKSKLSDVKRVPITKKPGKLSTDMFNSKAGFEFSALIEFDYDQISNDFVILDFMERNRDSSNPAFESFRFILRKNQKYYELTTTFSSLQGSDKTTLVVQKGEQINVRCITSDDEAYVYINDMELNLHQIERWGKMRNKNLYFTASFQEKSVKLKFPMIKVYGHTSAKKKSRKEFSGRYKKVRKELDKMNSVGANQAGIWIWIAIIAGFFIQFGIFFFM